jgi:translocation and assembly module TamB
MSRTEMPKPSRWKWYLTAAVGGLLILLWAAPIIVGYTPLVGRVTDAIEARIDGKVQLGGVSLGWFSPIVLYDVVVRDADNHVLAYIPRVQGDRALFKLLVDRSDLGSYRLDRAKIDIHCKGNGTNLERVFAKVLNEPSESPSAVQTKMPLPQLHLETVDATLTIHDNDTKQTWKLHGVSLSGRVLDQGKTAHLNMHGALDDGSEPGTLKLEMSAENLLEPNMQASAKGKFTSLPLAMTNVITRRYRTDFHLTGALNGHFQISASLMDGKPDLQLLCEIVGNQLNVRTPYLADDLRVQRVSAPCTIRLEAGKLIADRLEVESEFGKISVVGSLDLERDLSTVLNQAGFELTLDVNLATVAERLPKTLHLHHDLRLTAGQLQAKCKSVSSNGSVIWQGKLHTSDVRGVRDNQIIAWSDPLTLDFQMRDLHKGFPLFDSLKCSARFLRIEGTQTSQQFTLTAEADLQQLAEPLGQLIDLKGATLAGKATGKMVVRKTERNQFTLEGNAQCQNLNFAWFTKHAWQEPLLSAKFDARGSASAASPTRIDEGNVEIRLGSDVVTAQLTEPIADLAVGLGGMLAMRVDGDLARWHQRARSWTKSLDDYQLAGQANAQLRARVSTASIECTGVQVQATNLRCENKSMWINEPNVALTTAGRWSRKTGQFALTQTKLICPTVQADAAALTFTPATLALRGNINVAGDLARLQQWTRNPQAKPGEPLTGAFAGRVRLDTVGEQLLGDADLAVKNFSYGPALNPTWREAELRCVGYGGFDLAKDSLRFDQLKLVGAAFSTDAKGRITNCKTTTDLDLIGTLAYDLEKLEPQLRTILGKDVKITGKDTRAFKVAGALFPKGAASASLRFTELQGDVGVNWKSLQALGCEVGPAEMRAVLQKGWFQLYPIETTINKGKLKFQPNIRLDPEPMTMVLLAGPVIEKAQITPAMCAGAMAYALPMLANVAEAEGTVSVELEGGRLPLSAPTTGELKGTITLHAGKLGPGPILREVSGLLRVPPPASLIKESKVPFVMAEGKVHHRDLELVFPDYTLKSSGAVGMDGSLALVIEMPIPPQLAHALKLTPVQAKQLLRIPVGGTLGHPRPDPRALESLTAIVGRSFLENQLNKLLQQKR